MPFYICPNCKDKSVDSDGYEEFSAQAPQCRRCGFGFLFELLDDYYPAPSTGFVVCDADTQVIAVGRGVFELTGYGERDLLGRRSPRRWRSRTRNRSSSCGSGACAGSANGSSSIPGPVSASP